MQIQTCAPSTTDQFHAWFAGSKVVDADGHPLLVFHGTPEQEIRQFDRRGNIGTFFTADARLAQSYAETVGTVYSAYLALKNPLTWGYEETDAFQQWLLDEWLLGEREVPHAAVEDFAIYIRQHDLTDVYTPDEEGLRDAISEALKFKPSQISSVELDPLAYFCRTFAIERGHDSIQRYYGIGEGHGSADYLEYIAFENEQATLVAIGGDQSWN